MPTKDASERGGRKYDEPLSERLPVLLTASMRREMEEEKTRSGADPSDQLRRAWEERYRGRASTAHLSRDDVKAALRELLAELAVVPHHGSVSGGAEGHGAASESTAQALGLVFVPYLPVLPDVQWKEALSHSLRVPLHADIATAIGHQAGDVLLRVEGQGMEGFGLPDGCVALLRPTELSDRPGVLVLAEAQGNGGRIVYGLKQRVIGASGVKFRHAGRGWKIDFADSNDVPWRPFGDLNSLATIVATVVGRMDRYP